MLVNLTPNLEFIKERTSIAKERDFDYVPQSDSSFLLETGIYKDNFPFHFSKEEFTEKLEQTWIYGVADNIEQIKKDLKKYIKEKHNKYVIAIAPVFQDKSNKGNGGGWRWHKWGLYIGKLKPQHEYLDDEDFGDDFKYVLCFNLYKVVK